MGRRARRRERTAVWPSEGNPYRLMTAESSGRWKTRGLGFPGWIGRGLVDRGHTKGQKIQTYLRFWRHAPNLYPAEPEVKETCMLLEDGEG